MKSYLFRCVSLALVVGCSGGQLAGSDPSSNDGEAGPSLRPQGPKPPADAIDASCETALSGDYEASLPVPAIVVVEGDDRSARFQFGGDLRTDLDRTRDFEGFRVCWGPSTKDLRRGAIFANRVGQIFNLDNGEPLVAVLQTVDKHGNVSAPSEPVEFSASDERVKRMRREMTGFFDDFNASEGPLDELKWNVAFSACNDPTASHTYINKRSHAVSVLGNHTHMPGSIAGCDRDQNVARPRAVFDFKGREGRITFDFDGAPGVRSTWYVDVFPYESEADILDVTGHVSFSPGHGHPGRFLRFSQGGNSLKIHQLDRTGNPVHTVESDFAAAFPNVQLDSGGVMRHWELRVAKNYAAIYIDGVLVVENKDVDLDFERGIVHWSQFGYNPIKIGMPWHTFNWDNFGFDGPASKTVTHNYKTAFDRSDLFEARGNEPVTWSVEIPDSLEGAKSARLFYSIQTPNYTWADTDQFTVNGQAVPIPEPTSEAGTWEEGILAEAYPIYSTSVELPLAALQTGKNEFVFSTTASVFLNPHVEVYFDPGSAPKYTQPAAYLENPAVPALEPLGPDHYFRTINGEAMRLNSDGPYDILGGGEENPDAPLTIASPLSGMITLQVGIRSTRQVQMFARNLGVERAELLIDGEVHSTVQTNAKVAAPGADDGLFEWNQPHEGGVEFQFDASALGSGAHTLEVVTYDSEGNRGRPYIDLKGALGKTKEEQAVLHFEVP